MREIKFRFWDGERMILPNANFTSLVIRLSGRVTDGSTNAPGELMQFTGLKDKNGVEIYEGDIIRIPKYKTKSVTAQVLSLSVYGLHLGYITGYGGSHFWSHVGRRKEAEVIGNIYENPELLKD